MTARLGEARGIEIIDQFSDGPPVLLRTDQLRLKQILINLISNAIKYNKDGGKVYVKGQKTGDGFHRVSISDTGIGIGKEDYASVFHMFHRLGADPMISREGTGIGLTVSKLLIEQMAGRIGFKSEEGIGSTFWIELPLASNKDVLIWSNALSIGVDAIDMDHQNLLALVNRAGHLSIGDGELDEVIEELIDYTSYHFRREEAVMELCHYPNLEKHRGLHQCLTEEASELAEKWRKDKDPEALDRLRELLRDWLISHIAKDDSAILPYTEGKQRDIQNVLEGLG
jgi:hemerythrin-like metal-binding protein